MSKRMMLGVLMGFGMMMGIVARVEATDIYVPGSYTTIQEAVDGCPEGGTVSVGAGI